MPFVGEMSRSLEFLTCHSHLAVVQRRHIPAKALGSKRHQTKIPPHCILTLLYLGFLMDVIRELRRKQDDLKGDRQARAASASRKAVK